jgi:hypothetical protein
VLALLIAVPLLILVLPLALISWIWGLIPDSVAHLENRRLNALHAVFSRLNGDGHNIHSISKDELHHHWERTTGHTAERSTHVQRFINKLWDKLDKNKDGKVTIDELMNVAGVGKQWQTSAKESPLPTLTVDKPLQELLMAHPKLLLKVGLMQAFTTAMLIAWFGGVYHGRESWSSASKALYEELPSLAMHLAISWPRLAFSVSFKLPTLDWPSTALLVASLGFLAAEYLQKAIAWMDRKLKDKSNKAQGLITYTVDRAITLIHNLG